MTTNGVPIIGRELRVRLDRNTYQILAAYAQTQGLGTSEAAQRILGQMLSGWKRTRLLLTAVEAASIATGIQVNRGGA